MADVPSDKMAKDLLQIIACVTGSFKAAQVCFGGVYPPDAADNEGFHLVFISPGGDSPAAMDYSVEGLSARDENGEHIQPRPKFALCTPVSMNMPDRIRAEIGRALREHECFCDRC